MKKVIILKCIILLFLSNNTINAQGILDLKLTIIDLNRNPLIGIKVLLKEQNSDIQLSNTTDNYGFVSFKMTNGNSFKICYKDVIDKQIITIPSSGYLKQEMTITYIPKSIVDTDWKPQKRDSIKFEIIDQSTLSSENYKSDKAYVKVHIYKDNNVRTPLQSLIVNTKGI
jgi:hypothetical protein